MTRPLCFVLMPFGDKPDASGRTVHFDSVYEKIIRPAVEQAGLEPIRADEEKYGGLIHKPMFERLVLCEYAVADLSTANANVFYELGIRHAVRPYSTVSMFADGTPMPFDVQDNRGLPYSLAADGEPADVERDAAALADKLRAARDAAVDSPLFQLLELGPPDISRLKTDVFRKRVEYSEKVKSRLAEARKQNAPDAVDAVATDLEPVADREYGVAVDLLLSYRAVKAWDRMIALYDRMAEPHRRAALVREQLAFALNRAGHRDRAERVLKDLIEERGPSSETYGLLGRVYKDRWETARDAGETFEARGRLEQAIDAYRKGFEADWRDAYPGVNAVTLMELRESPSDEQRDQQHRILPVVAYSVERRIAAGKPDYWDHATALELAVLGRDQKAAEDALTHALPVIRETWEPETTLRNLRLIRTAREARGEEIPAWIDSVEEELSKRAGE